MTQSFEFLPDGDIENDGWTIVGGSATTVWEVLGFYEDDCYVRCPIYRGGLEIKFPFDNSGQFPVGAIIDSITVMARMKTQAGSGARGVTFNVLSSSNRSRYTTRTLYATSTTTTYEVATYSKDPLGRAWDIQTLNKLRLRAFSSNDLDDSIRLYGLWVVVNFHTKPTATVISPSGTTTTPSPVVKWSYSQYEAEPQKKAEYKVFTLTQTTPSTFNPDTAPPIYSTTVNGIGNEYVLPTSLNNNDYKVYVRVQSQYGAWSSWASKQFKVTAPAPGVPGDDNEGVAGIPGVGTPTVVPDNYTSSAAIRMMDTSNLLSVQQADFEIASDPLGWTGSAAALERVTSQAFADGVASMQITANSSSPAFALATKVEIYEGQPITCRAQWKAGSGSNFVFTSVRFFDETYTHMVGQNLDSAATTSTDTTWTESVVTGTVPAGARYAEVMLQITTPFNGEIHYVDHVGLMYGTNTAWSDGGHLSRNLLTGFLSSGDDPASETDLWTQANSGTTTTRVTATGTGAHGEKCNRMTYTGVSPSLGFRATSTIFSSATAGTNYTLNKPTGTADNDLLVAFVTSTEHGTINPPPGWTAVNSASVNDGSTDIALHVLKRTGLASDPASWSTGTLSVSSSRRTAVVVGYSGAAHADEQFVAEAVRMDASGSVVHKTSTIQNTDVNAWRISAFAASNNVTGGTFTANKDAPNSGASTISYVGRATSWQSTSSTLTYTFNKPSGVVEGDLMIAAVLFSGDTGTVDTPTGWTLVRKKAQPINNSDDHSGSATMCVYKRVATGSEPNAWTASHTTHGRPKITQVVAYRGCDSTLIAETANAVTSHASVNTGTVTNTNSKAWRINIFGATTNFHSSWYKADNAERADDSTSLNNWPDTVLAVNDSNGMVGTGAHSRKGTFRGPTGDNSFFVGIGWIGLLAPATPASLPTPGANETERVDNTNGSSNPWASTAVYDSNGIIGSTGAQTVYGQMSASDGQADSMASWIGLVRPASSVPGGVAAVYPNTSINVEAVDEEVFTLCANKLTMMADFKGSVAGTPTLTAEFYRADQLISRQSATGRAFNDSSFIKSWAVFDIPTGTTRIRPVLSAVDRAVNDTVDFDRVAVMFGSLEDPVLEPQWRSGTARPEHPVWSKPTIEYQENDGTGYGPWLPLAGQKARPPSYDLSTGQMLYIDHTIVPIYSRRYRVSTTSYGLNGDVFSSGFGPASNEAIFESRAWWLKDIQDLSRNMQVSVRWKDQQVDTTNMATSFQPIGADFPVVISEGFKGDTFSLEIHCESTELTALMNMLRSGRTLILQSDIDRMWWVRATGNVSANILATGSRQERPRRYVTVTFAQVAPEE